MIRVKNKDEIDISERDRQLKSFVEMEEEIVNKFGIL